MAARYATLESRSFHVLFESAEHEFGVNHESTLGLPLVAGDANPDALLILVNISTNSLNFTTANNVNVGTYGKIVALAGDYFGAESYDEAICVKGPTAAPAAFEKQWKKIFYMKNDSDSLAYLDHSNYVFEKQYTANLTVPWQGYAEIQSAAFSKFGLSEFLTRTAILLATYDHFPNCGTVSYRAGHQLAMQKAREAGADVIKGDFASQPLETRKTLLRNARASLEMAYTMNAFADHFLTDFFASGHLRTPRLELLTPCRLSSVIGVASEMPAGIASEWQHDEDNRNGLYVKNARNDNWFALGDTNFFDKRNARNAEILGEAAQISRNEVFQAFLGAPDSFAALELRPIADDTNPDNTCPLFSVKDGNLYRRSTMGETRSNLWKMIHGYGNFTDLGCSTVQMQKSDCPSALARIVTDAGGFVSDSLKQWLGKKLQSTYELKWDSARLAWVSLRTDDSPPPITAGTMKAVALNWLLLVVTVSLLAW